MPIELISFISDYGYLAIFLLVFIQELGVPNPVPNELLLVFSGFLAYKGILSLPLVFLVVVVADFIGTTILFLSFYFFGLYIIQHKPRWLPISQKTIVKFSTRIAKGGQWAIFLGRLTPYIRGYISVFTGLLHVSPRKFLPLAFISATAYASVCILIGRFMGPTFYISNNNAGHLNYFLIAILLALLLIFISFNFLRKKRVLKQT
ncbi:MAG: DedA family protein [Bacteroidota bacterium]